MAFSCMPGSVNRLPFALQPLSRIQVLLLLLLPALCVPRGVLLGFCLCDGATSGCAPRSSVLLLHRGALRCAGCCGGNEPGEHEQLVGVDDCACRTTIEIEEFESWAGAPAALGTLVAPTSAGPPCEADAAWPRRGVPRSALLAPA